MPEPVRVVAILQALPVRGVAAPPAQATRLRGSAPAVRPRHAALRQVLGAAPVRPQRRRHGVHLRRVAPLLLVNNANQDRTRDTDFYVENPYGEKPQAPTGDLHYMERVYRTQGIQ